MIITIDIEKDSTHSLKQVIALLEDAISVREPNVSHDVLGHLPHAEDRVHRTADPEVPPASLHPNGFGDIPPIVMGKRKKDLTVEPESAAPTQPKHQPEAKPAFTNVEIVY